MNMFKRSGWCFHGLHAARGGVWFTFSAKDDFCWCQRTAVGRLTPRQCSGLVVQLEVMVLIWSSLGWGSTHGDRPPWSRPVLRAWQRLPDNHLHFGILKHRRFCQDGDLTRRHCISKDITHTPHLFSISHLKFEKATRTFSYLKHRRFCQKRPHTTTLYL